MRKNKESCDYRLNYISEIDHPYINNTDVLIFMYRLRLHKTNYDYSNTATGNKIREAMLNPVVTSEVNINTYAKRL